MLMGLVLQDLRVVQVGGHERNNCWRGKDDPIQ